MDLTYIMPVGLNLKTEVSKCYYFGILSTKSFPDAKVLVKEVDTKSTFKFKFYQKSRLFLQTNLHMSLRKILITCFTRPES